MHDMEVDGPDWPVLLAATERALEASDYEHLARMALSDPERAQEEMPSGYTSYPFIHACVIEAIARNCREPLESDIRSEFYSRLSYYLPGASKIKYTTIRGHVPDGFVLYRGREVPVEIKRHVFGVKERDQLHRYMTVYDTELGIAVAPKLACGLPENMIFVEVKI